MNLVEAIITPLRKSPAEQLVEMLLDDLLDNNDYMVIINKGIKSTIENSTCEDYDAMKKKATLENTDEMNSFIDTSRYDFLIVDRYTHRIVCGIEVDGTQHFDEKRTFGRRSDVGHYQADRSKEAFLEANQIPLLRLRYNQINEVLVRFMLTDLFADLNKYVTCHNTFLSNEAYWCICE